MPTADWTASEFDRIQAAWPKQLAFVRKLHQAGVLLTVGSDVASPWVIHGVSFHQELGLLRQAGFSPNEVLQMATWNGARALGIANEAGTIQVGKRAHLVVLAADPLADINNSRRIRYVMLNGVLRTPKDFLSGTQFRFARYWATLMMSSSESVLDTLDIFPASLVRRPVLKSFSCFTM
jgi:imidazolonepropionase-like amidohydrolase